MFTTIPVALMLRELNQKIGFGFQVLKMLEIMDIDHVKFANPHSTENSGKLKAQPKEMSN